MIADLQPSASGRLPDFFIVGHARSGTTALYRMLSQHPEIYLPKLKEPWFFAQEVDGRQSDGNPSVAPSRGREMTLAQYLSLFAEARSEQRIGEGSTSYVWSVTAAARIARARPDARIIVIFREPVSFLRSLHLQLLHHYECEPDLRRAMALDGSRREGRAVRCNTDWPQRLVYSDRVRYIEQLRRYHALFPANQVLALIYDDFCSDNEATLKRVLRFLEVDDTYPIRPVRGRPTREVRSMCLVNLRRSLNRGDGSGWRTARSVGKALTSSGMRKALLYPAQRRILYRTPSPPDEDLMTELRVGLAGEVAALSEYLGRDLVSLWGYDRRDRPSGSRDLGIGRN